MNAGVRAARSAHQARLGIDRARRPVELTGDRARGWLSRVASEERAVVGDGEQHTELSRDDVRLIVAQPPAPAAPALPELLLLPGSSPLLAVPIGDRQPAFSAA